MFCALPLFLPCIAIFLPLHNRSKKYISTVKMYFSYHKSVTVTLSSYLLRNCRSNPTSNPESHDFVVSTFNASQYLSSYFSVSQAFFGALTSNPLCWNIRWNRSTVHWCTERWREMAFHSYIRKLRGYQTVNVDWWLSWTGMRQNVGQKPIEEKSVPFHRLNWIRSEKIPLT